MGFTRFGLRDSRGTQAVSLWRVMLDHSLENHVVDYMGWLTSLTISGRVDDMVKRNELDMNNQPSTSTIWLIIRWFIPAEVNNSDMWSEIVGIRVKLQVIWPRWCACQAEIVARWVLQHARVASVMGTACRLGSSSHWPVETTCIGQRWIGSESKGVLAFDFLCDTTNPKWTGGFWYKKIGSNRKEITHEKAPPAAAGGRHGTPSNSLCSLELCRGENPFRSLERWGKKVELFQSVDAPWWSSMVKFIGCCAALLWECWDSWDWPEGQARWQWC